MSLIITEEMACGSPCEGRMIAGRYGLDHDDLETPEQIESWYEQTRQAIKYEEAVEIELAQSRQIRQYNSRWK